MINSFCAILKKCNFPLYNHIAEKLQAIVQNENSEICTKIDIILYLLQMYRIDGIFDNYLKIKEVIDDINFETIKKKNEYWIECVKYYMCILNVGKAQECLENIETSNYDEYALKKAIFLNQLNKKKEAKDLVTSVIAYVSQQKYSENKSASLIGYANLVARAVWTIFDGQELFSDSLYEDNVFNCRKIVIASKDSIIETIFENQYPQNCRVSSFNPNSYTINHTMGSTNESKKIEASFRYLLLQDLLCLGIYRDHKNATEAAIRSVENTSESPLWRWYEILRINDKKIYDMYFTRERIYCTELSYVEKFYDEIVCMLEECVGETKNKEKLFVDCKTLTDIASKMTIVLDEDRILRLIKILIQIDATFEDKYDKDSIINSSLNYIHYSFNKKIFNASIEFILENKLIDYRFTSYFEGIACTVIENMEQQNKERFFKSVIKELDSEDSKIRDNAVNKYKIFEGQILASEYKDEIVKKLWEKTDEFGFPKNDTYLPVAWLNDSTHDVEEKIIGYLLRPQVTSNYNSGVVSSGGNADGQIWAYSTILYQMRDYRNNNIFTKDQLCEIIEYFYNYIKNEKNIVEKKNDFMGVTSQVRERFCKINNIILLLCISAKVSKTFDKDVADKIKIYLDQMEEIGIDTESIKISLSDIEEKHAFADFEKKILYGNEKDISSAFMILYGIIQISKSRGTEAIIDELLLQFMQKIPYFEISIGKRVMLELHNVLKRKVFLKDENMEQIVNILNICFDIYKNASEQNRKDGLDGMYNVSDLAKTYHEFLNESNIEISKGFESLIEKFKVCKLNEIKYNWS